MGDNVRQRSRELESKPEMIDLVLIPTFARPEYLTLCLEHLAAAEGGLDKHIWISHDRHVNDHPHVLKEIELTKQVIAKAPPFACIKFIEREPHPYIGNPCNFLELYKSAYCNHYETRYIYLVEDDVLVAPDFFKWHEAAQARSNYFVTVGWHCIRNAEVKPSTDPTAYIESTRDFSSIGICWKREKVAALASHAKPEYYRQMAPYLGKSFPGSPIPAGQWTEQAGVVTRLLHETKNRWVAWPSLARCAHVGIQGYHRPQGHKFSGTLQERVDALRSAVTNSGELARLSKDAFDDVAALQTIPEWLPEQLHVVQRFEYQYGKV